MAYIFDIVVVELAVVLEMRTSDSHLLVQTLVIQLAFPAIIVRTWFVLIEVSRMNGFCFWIKNGFRITLESDMKISRFRLMNASGEELKFLSFSGLVEQKSCYLPSTALPGNLRRPAKRIGEEKLNQQWQIGEQPAANRRRPVGGIG